ncbi:MAG: HAMP domain-containing sensor histidine kinase [Planctomycetota bacterium]
MLVGMLSHEVRNLLTPAMAYSQAALKTPSDIALSHRALHATVDAVSQVQSITNSILSMARLEEDAPTGPSRVELAVTSVLRTLAPVTGDDSIVYHTAVEPGLEVSVRDADLRHMLLNLIMNARDATARVGGGSVSIRAISTDAGVASIVIEDTGPGVPRDIIAWARAEPNESGEPPRVRGGLGISLARLLVARCGGRMDLDRRDEGGSAASLWLPLAGETATGEMREAG